MYILSIVKISSIIYKIKIKAHFILSINGNLGGYLTVEDRIDRYKKIFPWKIIIFARVLNFRNTQFMTLSLPPPPPRHTPCLSFLKLIAGRRGCQKIAFKPGWRTWETLTVWIRKILRKKLCFARQSNRFRYFRYNCKGKKKRCN